MPLRREVLRAHVTKRLAHGDRYLVTRVYVSDGSIEQRVNPGLIDDDLVEWQRVGRYDDLGVEREKLRREGWEFASRV